MDYKYIEQLLERYWRCETSLQEEEILRMFFSRRTFQLRWCLIVLCSFTSRMRRRWTSWGDDFDQRVLGLIQEDEPVKARVITMRHRSYDHSFKAAAVVAIFLTLGNAMQVAFSDDDAHQVSPNTTAVNKPQEGPSVAKADSVVSDTLQHKIQSPVSTITK